MPLKEYHTVRQKSEVELVIQKSRFIGRCIPVQQEQDALAQIASLKKQHWDASHNCFAYSIGPEGTAAKYSDDGEPGGTAGLPIMEALKKKRITDALVVVTRYFGGILLGAGGLVRAYSHAAADAIQEAIPISMRPCVRYSFVAAYSQWDVVSRVVQQYGQLLDVNYGADVRTELLIPIEEELLFCRAVADISDGRIAPLRQAEEYGAFAEK